MTTITTDPLTDARTRLAVPSPIGELVLEGDEQALSRVVLPDSARAGAEHDLARAPRALAEAALQLGEYFAGQRTTFELELLSEGTPFQREVWVSLRSPTASDGYAELAAAVQRPHAFRAVGSANGANPIATVIIPCDPRLSTSARQPSVDTRRT